MARDAAANAEALADGREADRAMRAQNKSGGLAKEGGGRGRWRPPVAARDIGTPICVPTRSARVPYAVTPYDAVC